MTLHFVRYLIVCVTIFFCSLSLSNVASVSVADDPAFTTNKKVADVQWQRYNLNRDFFSEGAAIADIDGDGSGDVIAGPYVYYGPAYEQKVAYYPPKAFSINGYSDNFFSFTYDIDRDGWLDILTIGFPGEATRWYRNPGANFRVDSDWERSTVIDVASNESPTFADITGDGVPELVCINANKYGYASIPNSPREKWSFIPVSEAGPFERFTHGMGIGDVNNDKRMDLIAKDGWWEQPTELKSDSTNAPTWTFHAESLTPDGGSQMFAVDLDGDGKNEIVTSLRAHGYGLVVYRRGDDGKFERFDVMTDDPATSPTGLAISQLHAVAIDDVNRDGRLDIITGKRFWAHQGHDVSENAPVLLVWFETISVSGRLRFVPHIVDQDCGVGTQITVADINHDGRVDLLNASKRGVQLFVQTDSSNLKSVEKTRDDERASKVRIATTSVPIDDTVGGFRPADESRRALNLGFETGTLDDWFADGAAFFKQPIRDDTVAARRNDMKSEHEGNYWIGSYEVVGDIGIGTLVSRPFLVTHPWASFRVGGGSKADTCVELIDFTTGSLIHRSSGMDQEGMKRAVVDLQEHQGKPIFIRVVDNKVEGWGHVNFDDFRLHDAKPSIPVSKALTTLDQLPYEWLAPNDASAKMKVPAGFSVQTIAAEPDVQQPIAMTIDERGRIWIAEAYEYPRKSEAANGRDRILIFEDTDHDGTLDRRIVFKEGLNLVSGIEVGFGGVWVGAAPQLLFIPDRNHDDVPDNEPEVVLDGWGLQDTHEVLNSFIWGPDGWLYGCHGVFTHSNVGKPGCKDPDRIPINAGIWRLNPVSKAFEVFAHGTSNPWGIDFNENGQAFLTACVIPHLYHIIQGARYQRQAGNHFNENTFDDIKTIANHRHWIGDNPHAGNNRSNDAGGGHAHSGAMFYQGGAWPAEYRNRLIMNNIHGARLNQDQITGRGSGFVGDRAPDFLLTGDRSSQILYFRSGPDGQVYAIDWYDIQQCHTKSPEDHRRGDGRIYRIAYNDAKSVSVDLGKRSDRELIEYLKDPNDWFARTARRLLLERSAAGTLQQETTAILSKMLFDEPNVSHRLQALWTLGGSDQLSDGDIVRLLADDQAYILCWAIQFLGQSKSIDPNKHVDALKRLAKDHSSPVVRLYLASLAGRMSDALNKSLVTELIQHAEDSSDHNLPLMYWYAMSRLLSDHPSTFSDLMANCKIDLVVGYAIKQMLQTTDKEGSGVVLKWLTKTDDPHFAAIGLNQWAGVLRNVKNPSPPSAWPAIRERFLQSNDLDIQSSIVSISTSFRDSKTIDLSRALVVDRNLPVERRRVALQLLRQIRDDRLSEITSNLLSEEAMRTDALIAIADVIDSKLAIRIVNDQSSWSADKRRLAIYALIRSVPSANILVDALVKKTVSTSDLTGDMVSQMLSLPGFKDGDRLTELWGTVQSIDVNTKAEVQKLKEMFANESASVDLKQGKALYVQICGQCHRLFGEGGQIGPELTGSNRKNLDYLFENIVNPSAVMAKEYQPWMVLTTKSRVLTGLLRRKSAESIDLQTTTSLETVYQDEIDEMKQSEQSMMPNNQLGALTSEQIKQLISYLQSDGVGR